MYNAKHNLSMQAFVHRQLSGGFFLPAVRKKIENLFNSLVWGDFNLY
ncbi:hypothetical protein ACI2JR_02410 [Klebsiella sp. NPDC088457]